MRSAGLAVLFCLHCFWWALFNRIMYRSIIAGEGSGGEIGDEDYEDVSTNKKSGCNQVSGASKTASPQAHRRSTRRLNNSSKKD